MAKQSLMWTALPNGVDENGSLRVSALLSPRLTPDADQILKPFKDFIDWPATVRDSKFTIHLGADSIAIGGGDTASRAHVDGSIDLADSATWKALLPPETFVAGYVFQDHSNHTVLSYDTVALHALAQNLYQTLGSKTSDQLPKISGILGDSRWQGLINAVAHIDRLTTEKGLRDVSQLIAQLKNKALQFTEPVMNTLVPAMLFHTPPNKPSQQDYSGATLDADDPRKHAKWRTFERATLPKADEFVKLIDFHQIVAAMNQYPRLLRRLGLVMDFIVPREAFHEAANQQLWITCELNAVSAPGVPVVLDPNRNQASPRTRTRYAGKQFDAVPRPTFQAGDYRVKDGLLIINEDLFAILQTDVDAAGLKLMNFARTLMKLQNTPELQADVVTRHEKDQGVPALRNAGLMLVHRRRSLLLSNQFASSKLKNQTIESSFANNALPGPDLFAEDLIRGWRLDIWDKKTQVWRSLCERHSTFTVGGAITVDDHEGIVRLAATQAADGTNQDLVYLHEALVSWTGWSLVAPQPGRAVDKDDASNDATAEVPPGLNLSSVFTARPGSLPRLRYGRSYWIRARMTDLAGNSLAPNPKSFGDENPEGNATLYTRFDPVQAPALALVIDGGNVEKPLEGESMHRIAIRTFNDTPDKNVIPTDKTARRFSVPGRSSVRDAELHSMLDGGGAVDGSSTMYDLLAKKDTALAEQKLVTPGPLTDPGSTVETSYAVLEAGATDIPYLPDPLCGAISARLFDHPTFPDTNIISIPTYSGKSWPNAAPFIIRVFEDPTQTPHFDADTRILQIPFPKAIRMTLRLSSQLDKEALAIMGIWNWLPVADRTLLAPKAVQGQHWMLTPWRNVEIVHATQKPLIAPQMKFIMTRAFGETRALPRFSATCSINSTARVDLQAAWHEPDSDSTTTLIGSDRARTDHAYSVKITDERSYATTASTPGATGIPDHDIIGTDMISVGLNQRVPGLKFHEFNDTRYRRVEYWLEATSRFREFMPSSVLTKTDGATTVETDENIKVTGPTVVAWIPNSSPPPAPKVLYVVPTFGRTATTNAQGTETRWRRGGGLRVYLDRPWNSSGYGEMLAVVLPKATFNDDPSTAPASAPYKNFVTQWGNDPIWDSNFVAGPAPKASAFTLARTAPDPSGKWLPSFAPPTEADQAHGPFQVTSLFHPGAVKPNDPVEVVDIAPHDVAYDPIRHLWYADIEINAGLSYFPFIRLALARYQPTSVQNAFLSNVVIADVIAITPDRWLSVTVGPNANSRNVSVFGWTYSNSSGNTEAKASPGEVTGAVIKIPVSVATTSTVEVWLERLHPELGTDFGWKRETVTPVAPVPIANINTVISKIDPQVAIHQAQLSASRNFNQLAQEIQIQPTLLWPQLWNGSIALPSDRTNARFRIAIAEFEEYIVDDTKPYNATPLAMDRRMVFLEYVEIK